MFWVKSKLIVCYALLYNQPKFVMQTEPLSSFLKASVFYNYVYGSHF